MSTVTESECNAYTETLDIKSEKPSIGVEWSQELMPTNYLNREMWNKQHITKDRE